jgi:hypothetical protein
MGSLYAIIAAALSQVVDEAILPEEVIAWRR